MVSRYGFKAVRSHLIQPWSQDADCSPELAAARSLHVQANTCTYSTRPCRWTLHEVTLMQVGRAFTCISDPTWLRAEHHVVTLHVLTDHA